MISRAMSIAAFAVAVLLAGSAQADDAAAQGREEIVTLQQRLTDAGCYRGAIDGAASASLDEAVKQCPDMKPFLRIETGMHTAQINQFGVDAACSQMATPSDDKTVRLWSLPDGKLERTIRLPIGDGDDGKLYAAALLPNGRRLAVGGWDAASSDALYVVDLGADAVRRFGTLPDVVDSVAFSPDGTRIAVGLGGDGGLRVFDAGSGAQLFSDTDYADTIYGLAYAPDGALIVASDDGAVRRYSAALRREQKRTELAGRDPFSVAVSPDGRTVAVGFYDEAKVTLLDAKTLRTIAEADSRGLANGDLSNVAWSADGRQLVAGGTAKAFVDGQWRRLLRSFSPDARRLGADVPAALNRIVAIRPCADGFVFAGAEPSFGRIGRGGPAETLQGPRVVDMRLKLGAAFAVSADGATVRFGLGEGAAKPALFDLVAGTLAESPSLPASLAPARADGLPVASWHDDYKPTLRGAAIALQPYERSRSLAIRPDGSGFALGTEWWVRAYDADGKELWQQPGPGAAWGVDYSGDGRTLVVAYGDGTIRWRRASDGAELLALFVEPQTRKWVAWTPGGYYMASPGGEDLIGWQLNRGWAQLADFFPASRFSDRFNRPDIVKLVLKTGDEAEAVRQANEGAKRKPDTSPIAAALPPVVTIISPPFGASFSGDTVDVAFEVRSPSGLAVDRVDALVDGQPVTPRGLEPASGAGQRHLQVPIPARDAEISLIARSGDLVSVAARVKLAYAGRKSDEAEILKPKLYAVVIGVSDYADPALQLGYAADDARGVAEALQNQEGGLYQKVEIRRLIDRDATRSAVIDALDWLDKQVTSRDIAVVMLAGHGDTDAKGHYWFLAADAAPDRLRATAVSQSDLRGPLSDIAGKKILFLDTCHANAEKTGPGEATDTMRGLGPAGVDVASLVNDFSRVENGLVTFAATQGTELAAERAEWRHGAFSLALIEGLSGKADLMHKGAITVSALDYYIAERVKTLTDGHQHPVMSRPDTVPDFAFAMAK